LHVQQEFKNENVFVLDGGDCQIGIESTVLLIRTGGDISILRQGQITALEIQQTLSELSIPFQWVQTVDKKESPGHMQHHYMPAKPLIFCTNEPNLDVLKTWLKQKLGQLPQKINSVEILRPQKIEHAASVHPELGSNS
jgi:L-threonylcarbamoyladenylate synthase